MPKNKAQARPFPWPLVMVGAGVLLILVTLGMGVAYNSPRPTPTPTSWVLPEIVRVSLEDAHRANERGNAIFLDVRDSISYDSGHIPGAKNATLDQLASLTLELDLNTWIITYCT
jgi:3-mercaptopyruvate sulfurtransferase SseA